MRKKDIPKSNTNIPNWLEHSWPCSSDFFLFCAWLYCEPRCIRLIEWPEWIPLRGQQNTCKAGSYFHRQIRLFWNRHNLWRPIFLGDRIKIKLCFHPFRVYKSVVKLWTLDKRMKKHFKHMTYLLSKSNHLDSLARKKLQK